MSASKALRSSKAKRSAPVVRKKHDRVVEMQERISLLRTYCEALADATKREPQSLYLKGRRAAARDEITALQTLMTVVPARTVEGGAAQISLACDVLDEMGRQEYANPNPEWLARVHRLLLSASRAIPDVHYGSWLFPCKEQEEIDEYYKRLKSDDAARKAALAAQDSAA